ncbi:Flp pilus assembly complex ATPase component TadA, partial [Candidatus Woesearchaeota archaeon]|nr:Flp pilus assembly complex ATPase component TadA [Candidatus Woesearchaeota archaeon]
NKTFEVCLRALLRQDPDNIMVGEMRDLETAKMAVRAALTGHLVLSTLHTNSTAETITRLMDMGIESYLVAPTLLGIMGQRLVRRICNGCREETSPQNAELFIAAGLDPIAYQGTGCGECFNTGYKGRIGIYEYFPVAPAFVPDISSMEAIGKLQQKREVISFLNYGLRKVSQGLTTESEVLENTAI